MTRGIAIPVEGIVQHVTEVRIACDGVVKDPTRIVVACGGVARVVWPPNTAPAPTDPERIVLTTDPFTALDYETAPADAVAWVRWNPLGTLSWRVDETESSEVGINPQPAPNDYLVRLVTSTGTIAGPTGWQDAATALLEWTVTNSADTTGVVSATGTFEIAVDDGAGNPVGGTEVVKPVTFNAYVTAVADILWTPTPWLLEDRTTGITAEVALQAQYVPYQEVGFGRGFEGLGRARLKFEEKYADPTVRDEQVRIIQDPSKPAGNYADITGALKDTWLPLDFVNAYEHTWTLENPNVGTLRQANVLFEFQYGDGSIVSKPVEMIAEYVTDVPPGSTLDPDPGPFAAVSSGVDYASLTIIIRDDGTWTVLNQNGVVPVLGGTVFWPQNWSSDAPIADGDRFDVRLVNQGTGTPPNGVGNPAPGAWVPVSDLPTWTLSLSSQEVGSSVFRQGTYLLEWRLRDDPDIVGSTIVSLQVDVQNTAPGGGNPFPPDGGGVEP